MDVKRENSKAILFLLIAGDYRKEELLEAARNGDEKVLLSYLTPFNVNCHSTAGRKVRIYY